MSENSGNRPSEIFGYPVWDESLAAQNDRRRCWCPFQENRCSKKSRLIDFPFGVCSVEHRGSIHAICPHRFEEQGSSQGVSRVFEDIALHYFGDLDNTIVFSEVRLENVGSIDYVLVRHKPMKPEVDDFVSIEFQSDSTTSMGPLVQSIRGFSQGHNIQSKSYAFGMNTYDSIKRTITQLMNKGIVYESWNTKCYWVIQEYMYANLVNRYGLKLNGFSPNDASRFALYELIRNDHSIEFRFNRFISTTVDEVYQAMRNKPGMPDKDRFVGRLNDKLRPRLSVQIT